MNSNTKRLVVSALILSMALSILSGCKKDDVYRIVKVESFNGSVMLKRESEDTMSVFEGMNLVSEDNVTVGDSSDLSLLIDEDKHLYAEANTEFTVTATGDTTEGLVRIDLANGKSLFTIENKLSDKDSFEVTTPNAICSVRGTRFSVSYDVETNTTELEVFEGTVSLARPGSSNEDMVPAGEGRRITDDSIDVFTSAPQEVVPSYVEPGDMSSEYPWVYVADDDEAIREGYRNLIRNIDGFEQSRPEVFKYDYTSRSYMIFDIDQDGRDEIILCYEYSENGNDLCKQVIMTEYNQYENKIMDFMCWYDTAGGHDLYGNYNGSFAAYRTYVESNLSTIVIAHVTNTVGTVSNEEFNTVYADPSEIGFEVLPMYDIGVIPFED